MWMWVITFTLRPLYSPWKNLGTYWVEDWVGLRTSLDSFVEENISCSSLGSSPGSFSPVVTIPTTLSMLPLFPYARKYCGHLDWGTASMVYCILWMTGNLSLSSVQGRKILVFLRRRLIIQTHDQCVPGDETLGFPVEVTGDGVWLLPQCWR